VSAVPLPLRLQIGATIALGSFDRAAAVGEVATQRLGLGRLAKTLRR
jgi:hypothetical protein